MSRAEFAAKLCTAAAAVDVGVVAYRLVDDVLSELLLVLLGLDDVDEMGLGVI